MYQYAGSGLPTGVANTSNVYTSPGSYTILQTAAGPNATGTLACRVVEVLPVKAVSFSLTSCANREAKLTFTLDAETIRYNTLQINWGDGSAMQIIVLNGTTTTATVPHTFAGAAVNYVVQLLGSYNNPAACAGAVAFQPVRIQAGGGGEPTINFLTSGPASATINYQGPEGYGLELYQKGANGSYSPTGLTGTSGGYFTVPAVGTSVNCYQLVAKDGCGSPERRSTEVCSLALTATAADRQNNLNWQPYSGTGGTFGGYRIYKDGGAPFFSGPYGNRQITSAVDNNDIVCGESYCYVLEARIDNTTTSPTTVRSMSTCVTGLDNGSVVSPTSAYVSVQPNGVSIQATLPALGLPTNYTLVFSRATGAGGAFSPVATSNDRSYVDATAQTGSEQYCYQTAIRNGCGVLSAPTPPACTILLSRSPTGELVWTSESPFSGQSPRDYSLSSIDPATGLSDKKSKGLITTFRPDVDSQVTQYQITAVDSIGISSYSNPLEIELGLRIFLPNAFTPNANGQFDPKGQNDAFMAKGLVNYWDTFELTIYSRWGDVVYSTTDKNTAGWNGQINGVPAASGYYGYRVRVTDNRGKAHDRTGQVLLIR